MEYNLSVDQFILALLRHAGGDLRQQEFVRYTGWSTSKVSRNLCRLEAEGRIRRVQFGRQKVVYFPGSGP
ncbi:helix-turn-helix transcriptional regulator [Haloarchaeobius sp. DYHT-AS-18]|uniref:helix-turn-helix transcriptional regulator n=1 Tax=Haloarchaeobius sp. DYHT-AS-18 TaxID=3446117 RepID=UPI003EB71FEE